MDDLRGGALGQEYLRERFQRAVDEGDLPTGAEPDLIARYVVTIANGLAVQPAALAEESATPG